LEALKERNTIQELATKYEVHLQQITDWKRQFMDNSEAVEKDKLIDQLYAQIGQLKVENDFLKKN